MSKNTFMAANLNFHPLCNAHTAHARLDKAARRGYNKTSESFMIKRLLPLGGIFMQCELGISNL